MAAIGGEYLELEVKHREKGSWHPCRVSLSSTDSKFSIIVDFENSNEEETMTSRKDALQRLRFRSTPLQGGECSHVKEGDTVLAVYKDQFKSMFFDAVIEKAHRVKHSNRVFCRCNFEVKWCNSELKEETTTVPSKSILKLSREEIESHPTFAAFLKVLSAEDGMEVSSSHSVIEEADIEDDLYGILEKQIEEISKLAHRSTEGCAENSEVKRAKLGGRKQSKTVVALQESNSRRTTRSQVKKDQTEAEPKKGVEGDRPFLTPLAARAALASLVHGRELPVKRELPFSHMKNESLLLKDSKNLIEMHSTEIRSEYVESGASSCNDLPTKDGDVDLHIQSGGVSTNSNQKGARKSCEPKEVCSMKKSLYGSKESEGEGHGMLDKPADSPKIEKVSRRSMTTRVTRASLQKEAEALTDEVKDESSREKVATPVNMARKTRASLQRELDSLGDKTEQASSSDKRLTHSRNQKEKKNSEADQVPETTGLINATEEIPVKSEGKKRSLPTVASNSTNLKTGVTKRVTRSSMQKEPEALSDVEQGSSARKLASDTLRLTHSKEKSKASSDKEVEDTTPIQASDVISEDITADRTESGKKRLPVSLPDMDSHEGSDKRSRASSGAKPAIEEESGIILEDGGQAAASAEKKRAERKKAVQSQKPQLRSSPRLNSLQRSSQGKP